MAEKSFRFYRNIGINNKMPDIFLKEWEELQKRVEQLTLNQNKNNKISYGELCALPLITIVFIKICNEQLITITINL